MNLEIKKFNELTGKDVYEILKVRSEIFVVEQNCIYNDEDGKDEEATHIVLRKNNKIVAYLRIIKPGISYESASIGRVLVTSKARKKGLAKKIVQIGIDHIINKWGEEKITIGAQNYLRNFYESLGFEAISEIYLEDGIDHIDMSYNKK